MSGQDDVKLMVSLLGMYQQAIKSLGLDVKQAMERALEVTGHALKKGEMIYEHNWHTERTLVAASLNGHSEGLVPRGR